MREEHTTGSYKRRLPMISLNGILSTLGGSELLYAPSDLHLKEDNEEAVDGEDNEDVPVELSH